jgi:hypothetical protein
MGAAGAPMVNGGAPMVDDSEDDSSSSSDEEEENVIDMSRRLEYGRKRKKHARVQVKLPAGTQPNVVRINTFCANTNPLWGHIEYTEVAALPHTTANRFEITDDLVKAYENIAARANVLRVTKPAEDGGSRVMLMPLVSETLEAQGVSILEPPPGSGERRVFSLNKNVPVMLAQGYTVRRMRQGCTSLTRTTLRLARSRTRRSRPSRPR